MRSLQVCLVRVFVGAGGVSRHTSLQGLGRGRRCDHSLGTRVVPLAAPPCPALILCVLFRLGAVMGEGLLCLQVRELCDETACERGRPASELNCIPHGQLRLLVRGVATSLFLGFHLCVAPECRERPTHEGRLEAAGEAYEVYSVFGVGKDFEGGKGVDR